MLQRSSYLLLAYRKAGKTYNEDELLELLRDTDEIEYDVYFRVYELTADESYLEQAYQKLLERTSDLNNSENFLTYPVPRKIVDGWESLSTSSPT